MNNNVCERISTNTRQTETDELTNFNVLVCMITNTKIYPNAGIGLSLSFSFSLSLSLSLSLLDDVLPFFGYSYMYDGNRDVISSGLVLMQTVKCTPLDVLFKMQ